MPDIFSFQKFPKIIQLIVEREDLTNFCLPDLLRSGVGMLQYRTRGGTVASDAVRIRLLHTHCRRLRIPLVINDDVGFALEAGADGVHLGQRDMAVHEARKHLGSGKIIGVTCHDSLTLAQQAKKDSADYVSFGAAFPSPTKPQAQCVPLSKIIGFRRYICTPVCLIGGINPTNIKNLADFPCQIIAMASGIMKAPSPLRALRTCLQCLTTCKLPSSQD